MQQMRIIVCCVCVALVGLAVAAASAAAEPSWTKIGRIGGVEPAEGALSKFYIPLPAKDAEDFPLPTCETASALGTTIGPEPHSTFSFEISNCAVLVNGVKKPECEILGGSIGFKLLGLLVEEKKLNRVMEVLYPEAGKKFEDSDLTTYKIVENPALAKPCTGLVKGKPVSLEGEYRLQGSVLVFVEPHMELENGVLMKEVTLLANNKANKTKFNNPETKKEEDAGTVEWVAPVATKLKTIKKDGMEIEASTRLVSLEKFGLEK